jgi:hypothetical protein
MTLVFWKYVWACFIADKASIIAFCILIITAMIKTAPVPGPPWFIWDWKTFYTWGYDGVHQFFNMPNNRLATQSPPSPPPPPAEQANVPNDKGDKHDNQTAEVFSHQIYR